MENIKINFNSITGKIKPMHAVNNGPIGASDVEQTRGNFSDYKKARIPYARNHDASFCSSYGGEHTVDVNAIFTDFSKNPYDPQSYDFTLTDDYVKIINDAGTKVFYRLGTKIEHWRKKYNSIVPADFHKWAVVCEHIIRHYTLGWADGFNYDIEYWEIWNEPDGIKPDGDQPNWSGTPEQYYELYGIASRHLKKCFPDLKIGGPALSWIKHEKWLDNFLASLNQGTDRAPLDFFSWHSYQEDPYKIISVSEIVRKKLDEAGYTETENICNEWNYLENWTDKFIASIEAITGMRGAAFTSAVMALGQKSTIDMLMYYDARPCVFNGLFDFYTFKPLKGYYPFCMFSELYDLKNEVYSGSSHKDINIVAAAEGDRKAAMLTYYSADKSAQEKEITVELSEEGEWQTETLDNEKTMEKQTFQVKDGKLVLKVKPDTVIFISKRG
ncbi:MAG: hypothetical protein E7389_04955 [Ruminococcaceae bacterium]|nr:hypothetical protein [Oscillospiraceae bacterium]